MNTTGCIIPIRGIKSGKQRIRRNLPSSKGPQISSMISQVLRRILNMCSQYFDHIWLMTRYPADTQTVVNDNEIVIIGDPNGDLNSSLNLVAEDMASIANLVAVITADLPLLRSDDLRRLLTSCEDGNAVIAPSKDVGTSGILIPVESCSAFREFHFAFGDKSFDKHVKAFSRANLNYRVLRTSGFIWDLDDVDDIGHILRDENNRLPVSLQKILDNLLKVDKNQ